MPDQRLLKSQWLLPAYSLFVTLSSLLAFSTIVLTPSEPASAILLGFSASRLVMIVGLLLVLFFFATITFRSTKDHTWGMQFVDKWFTEKIIGILSGVGFILGWIGCFLPAYRVGILENYWLQIHPVMVFILFASLATLIMFLLVQNKVTFQGLDFAGIKLGLPLFIFLLLVLGGMFLSGFGVTSKEDFWYGAGVPILASQLFIAVMTGALFLHIEPKWQSKWIDTLICVLIYGLTAYLWSSEPLQKSFFLTGPSVPNKVFYPFSDAATFDMGSQFPLVGEKFHFSNNIFFERPLYSSFLVYLHLLFDQDYEMLMKVQAGVFAVFPVLIYLIGKSLNARSVGLGSAIVATLRGINSIYASNMIDMANPKMMLTDFPSAIGVALITLFICKWMSKSESKWYYLAWIGGMIGFTLLLRTNALVLLAIVPIYIFFELSGRWKQWLISSFLIILGVVAITLPWELRNRSLGGQMYNSIAVKIQAVIEQRYLPKEQTRSYLPLPRGLAHMTIGNTQAISILYRDAGTIQDEQPCDTVACFSSNHFLHNSLTSILIFPTSPVMDDLRHLIRDNSPYYWRPDWDGTLNGVAPLFLVINMFMIATGITFAWKKKKWQGLTPLMIFVAYNISNGLARTSGGRYIVPMDWIVPLYYLFGVFYIITWMVKTIGIKWNVFSERLLQEKPKHNTTTHLREISFVFIVLFGFGSLIPLSENLREPRYEKISPMETLAANRALIEDAGLKFEAVDIFLQNTNAIIFIGRALYPRYYEANQGEAAFGFFPDVTMDIPRTAFMVIESTGQHTVLLPGDVHRYFPHASDVLILGCNTKNFVEAFIVIILDEQGAIYIREPLSEFRCSLQ